MPRVSDRPLHHMHFRVYKEDYERAERLFGDNIGVTAAFRAAIHSFMTQTEARIRTKIDEIEKE